MATRPYQGYPFTNPHVTDAPSIDAATASRWNDLPRRPIQPVQPVIYVDIPEGDSHVSVSIPMKPAPPMQPVQTMVYVDIPEGDSFVSVSNPVETTPRVQLVQPVVCVDIPEGDSIVSMPNPQNAAGKKYEPEPEPVIYIDVPESSGSDVAGPATPEPEPEYVQETIFYDPFENRRIDQQKPFDAPDTDGAGPSRPTRPDTLDLQGASGSSGYASSSLPTYSTPGYTSKEASIYGRDDGFSLSPLPLSPSHHPEPPPAYSEIETPQICTPQGYTPQSYTPQTLDRTPQTPETLSPVEPPRTIVITQGPGLNQQASIGLASPNRKQLYCQHCGNRVYTLVIRETGTITHVIASILCVCMLWPFVLLLYTTNAYKYKNHYCPNCNKKIGHEMPALCMDMTYTKTDTIIRLNDT